MSFYLAIKEMLRNKFRFLIVSLIVALVTLLVLFLFAVSEGLVVASSEYITSIDAELFAFREDANNRVVSSSLGNSRLNDLSRVEGVTDVGPIGFSSADILLSLGGEMEKLNIALIGVEPAKPGAPAVFTGAALADERAREVVIDQHVLDRANLPVGSTIRLEALQGTKEMVFPLTVVGHTAGKKYNLPSIFVPLQVWNEIKPQERRGGGEIIFNIAAIKLTNPEAALYMQEVIRNQVNRVELADPVTTYQSAPGYMEMEMVFKMEQFFILFVALLVVGGFFQIQALQKVVQIGMLKAIGASNSTIALTVLSQVMLTVTIGMIIGGLALVAIASMMPPAVPLLFNGTRVLTGIITLFLIGPIASLISIRTLLKVEPLKALGLGV